MGLLFEWDPDKATRNEQKHNVTFDEAQTVFEDPLSVTVFDPLHSDDEDRFVIIGLSGKNRLSWYHLLIGMNDSGSSVHASRANENAINMKKATKSDSDDEMLPEYDFSKGVRGKYAKRYAQGTNVVLLAPDVARVFKN